MGQRPLLKKILQLDYVALMGSIFAVIAAGSLMFLAVILAASEEPDLTFWLVMAITYVPILIIAPAGIAAWRIWRVYDIFANSTEAPAVIERVSVLRSTIRIDYRYTYLGKQYRRGAYVVNIKKTRAIQPGTQITVLIDARNPNRVLIRDLYV